LALGAPPRFSGARGALQRALWSPPYRPGPGEPSDLEAAPRCRNRSPCRRGKAADSGCCCWATRHASEAAWGAPTRPGAGRPAGIGGAVGDGSPHAPALARLAPVVRTGRCRVWPTPRRQRWASPILLPSVDDSLGCRKSGRGAVLGRVPTAQQVTVGCLPLGKRLWIQRGPNVYGGEPSGYDCPVRSRREMTGSPTPWHPTGSSFCAGSLPAPEGGSRACCSSGSALDAAA
jgi:hypothetical protein